VRAVTSYAQTPLTHQVTNVGSTLFRLIAVPNLGPGADGEATDAMPGERVDDSRWFRWRRVTLAPGQATDWHTAGAPIAAVAIRGDRTWVDRRDGWAATLARGGDVGVLEAGAGYRIRNVGTAEAEVVLVEVR
jgi:quercetin dioxygenase-like cupin family protein